MKTNLFQMAGSFRALACAAALGLLGIADTVAQPFSDPSANVWDCVVSGGKREGVAQIDFDANGTFVISEVIVPKAKVGESVNPRGGGGANRGDEDDSPSAEPTHVFGFFQLSGQWGFDTKGRVIGYFAEIVEGECTTNTFEVTIGDGTNSITYTTNMLVCDGVTNSVSFTGVVKAGQRLALVCSTPHGKVSYRGVPQVAVTDLNNTSWFGTKKENKQSFIEFFGLTTSGLGLLNTYDATGGGPGYTYDGICMVSAQKKIGFVLPHDNSDLLRSVSGAFNPVKLTVNSTGVEQAGGTLTNKIKFSAVGQVALPPS